MTRGSTSNLSMMGGCLSWMKRKNKPKRTLTLAILGLDNAGKTVTALGLQGESVDAVAPTVGFSTSNFQFDNYDITLYDLGGGKNIRGIWKNYYSEIYGLIFVLDSTEKDRLNEAKSVLNDLLDDQQIRGKPTLILANKQDVEGAMDEIDLVECLNLESIANQYKSPCRIEACAALKSQGKKGEKSIRNGFEWLLETIEYEFEYLDKRVTEDMRVQKEIEAEERKARLERVGKIREERAKKEEAERLARGETAKPEDEEEEMIVGDPFKPLDINELTKKEQELKAAKAAAKLAAAESRKDIQSNDDGQENIHLPPKDDFSRKSPRQLSAEELLAKSQEGVLPPIGITGHTEDDLNANGDNIVVHASEKSPQKVRIPSPLPFTTSRSRDLFDDEESDELVSPSTMPPRRLMPLDGSDGPDLSKQKKKKKKKKRPKRNQTVPLIEEDEDLSDQKLTPTPVVFSKANSHSENTDTTLTTGFDSKFSHWGLADDLPEVAEDITTTRHSQPNFDDDNIVT